MNRYLVIAAVFTVFLFLTFPIRGFAQLNPDANVTIHFTGMGPHLNQNLYLKVVDKGTMKETGRIIQQITTANCLLLNNQYPSESLYSFDVFPNYAASASLLSL